MYCIPANRINSAVRHIARSAEQTIKDRTGISINLVLCSTSQDKTPEQLLKVIAIALNMSPRCFSMRSRLRDIVDLRFVAALLLRTHFPRITLQQIAALYGGQDHSSVINGMIKAKNLLHTGDTKFISKYSIARKAIEVWLGK
jgi:chromosomal replication initiation ATPase DnaA